MLRVRVAVLGLLCLAALGAVAPGSSSADCYRVVAPVVGGFNEAACHTQAAPRVFAYGAINAQGHAWACLNAGLNIGVFEGPFCGPPGGNKEYEWFRGTVDRNRVFTVARKTYVLEGKGKPATTIECTKMSGVGGEIAKSGLEVLGKANGAVETDNFSSLEYSGCTSKTPTGCTVNSPGKAAGVIATAAVVTEAAQNTAKTKAEQVVKPKEGPVLASVEYKSKEKETCSLDKKTEKLEGSYLLEVTSANAGAEAEQLSEGVVKAEAASKTYLNSEGKEVTVAGLKFAGGEAKLSGEATVTQELSEKVVIKNEAETESGELEKGSVDFVFEK